jgi:flagellar basal body-associated protein FliL
MKAKDILIVVTIILSILLLVAAWWGFSQRTANQQLESHNETLTQEISDLEELKVELQSEVDSLEIAYETLSLENDSLSNSLTDSKLRVGRRDKTISKLKKSSNASKAEISNLKAEIQALLEEKATLANSIASLQMENDSLRTRTGLLEADLGISKQENAALTNLNRTMQGDIDNLTLANFKATAFQVELERKNTKVTAKSRKVKKILVSFDLTNVPAKYQGVRPLYLVITDDKATPIKLENPINATVSVNGQVNEILAAEAKEVKIEENQRLSFSHEMSNKLAKGYYRVIVYTDIGLLGASNFRLR